MKIEHQRAVETLIRHYGNTAIKYAILAGSDIEVIKGLREKGLNWSYYSQGHNEYGQYSREDWHAMDLAYVNGRADILQLIISDPQFITDQKKAETLLTKLRGVKPALYDGVNTLFSNEEMQKLKSDHPIPFLEYRRI